MEYRGPMPGSLRLDVISSDHLAPFLGFLGDEATEVGGRASKHRPSEVCEARFYLGVGSPGVDLPVEPVDDFRRCVLRRS
jgi:hypothetical protein